MAFVDECVIEFIAGNGGNGIVAWRREAHVPLGGPAGGNGGNGGHIIIVGDHNENTLQNLKYLKKIKAEHGENGSIKTQHGRNGKDVIVKVPVGTILYDIETGKEIADIKHHQQQFVICEGGAGGKGNFHFKSNYNKAPSLYELGDLGQIRNVKLILKHIADIGIVGLPNAGKSTFISMITHAKPKTADYQFTTLKPVLGTYYSNNKKIIFADIPGLIKGAADGLGLGHDFLKHIERTKVLIHIVSMDSIDNTNVIDAYDTIIKELETYSPALIKDKPMIIVANKLDAVEFDDNYQLLLKHLNNKTIFKTSTMLNEGLDDVVISAIRELNKKNELDDEIIKIDVKVIDNKKKISELSKELKITKIDDHIFNVECEFLEYWSRKIPLNTQDNIVRFNQKLNTVEFEKKLKEFGAVQNDSIKLYNLDLNFEE